MLSWIFANDSRGGSFVSVSNAVMSWATARSGRRAAPWRTLATASRRSWCRDRTPSWAPTASSTGSTTRPMRTATIPSSAPAPWEASSPAMMSESTPTPSSPSWVRERREKSGNACGERVNLFHCYLNKSITNCYKQSSCIKCGRGEVQLHNYLRINGNGLKDHFIVSYENRGHNEFT